MRWLRGHLDVVRENDRLHRDCRVLLSQVGRLSEANRALHEQRDELAVENRVLRDDGVLMARQVALLMESTPTDLKGMDV